MARKPRWLLEQEPVAVRFEVLQDIAEELKEGQDALPKGVIMKVRGKFAHADKVTSNGTLYPRKLLERESKRMKPLIEERAVLMLSDHPPVKPDGTAEGPKVRDVIGGLTQLDVLPSGEVWGEADIADTVAGQQVAKLVRAGFKVGVSSRGRGTATERELEAASPLAESNREWVGKKVRFINDDLQLKSFDVVVDQSVPGAKIDDFQEEENTMEGFKLENLTEKDWEQITTHERVKGLLEAELKKQGEELRHAFEAEIRSDVAGLVAEFIRSKEFFDRFEAKQEKPEGAPATEAAEGVEDKRFDLLEAKISGVESENKKLREERDREREAHAVQAIIEEELRGKAPLIVAKTKEALARRELHEEDARESVKQEIAFVEGILQASQAVPAGSGLVIAGDQRNNSEVSEQGKEQQGQAKLLAIFG